MNRSDIIVKAIEDKLLAMSPYEREQYLEEMGFEYEKSKVSYLRPKLDGRVCKHSLFARKPRHIERDNQIEAL